MLLKGRALKKRLSAYFKMISLQDCELEKSALRKLKRPQVIDFTIILRTFLNVHNKEYLHFLLQHMT